jgi:hypothetical protein
MDAMATPENNGCFSVFSEMNELMRQQRKATGLEYLFARKVKSARLFNQSASQFWSDVYT